MFLFDNELNSLAHFTKRKREKNCIFRYLNKYKSLDGEIKFKLQ